MSTAVLNICNIWVEQLKEKSLEETEVERDFSIRLRIRSIFNKFPEDFTNVDEFRDYEEQVEDIIHNLVNYVEVDATNQIIEKYKQDNAKRITMNQMKMSEKFKQEQHVIQEDVEQRQANDASFNVRILKLSAVSANIL